MPHWASVVYSILAGWASECYGKTEYSNDLPLRLEWETPFRERLHGYHFCAYHYTRLLPHEREIITTQGLRMLSADLLVERIQSAFAIGAISEEEAEVFHRAHVFAVGEERYREGQVQFTIQTFSKLCNTCCFSQAVTMQINAPTGDSYSCMRRAVRIGG
jgi:hypothetical protein